MNINFQRLPTSKYSHAVLWSVIASVIIVVAMAGLGRAAINFHAALTDKPDVALYLLLPKEGITTSTLLREQELERDYLVETMSGSKLITLKRGAKEWYVSSMESLHGDHNAESGAETR